MPQKNMGTHTTMDTRMIMDTGMDMIVAHMDIHTMVWTCSHLQNLPKDGKKARRNTMPKRPSRTKLIYGSKRSLPLRSSPPLPTLFYSLFQSKRTQKRQNHF